MLIKAIRDLAFIIVFSVFSEYVLAVDSTDSTFIPTVTPAAVFLLEQGYINTVTSGSEQQGFTTTKSCPPNFSPYAVIRFSKIASSTNDFLQGFGACVNGIGSSGTGYNVGFLVSRKYATASASSNSGLYVSKSSVAFTNLTSQSMPGTTSMSETKYSFTELGGFYWDLYCYPAGMTTPTPSSMGFGSGCFGGQNDDVNPY